MEPDTGNERRRAQLGTGSDHLRPSLSRPGAAGHGGPPDHAGTADRGPANRQVVSGGADAPVSASAGDPDVFCLGSLLALGDVELDLLPFVQAAVAATGDRAEMHEHVRAALDGDEAITLVAVEPLHSALRHLDLLVVLVAPRHGQGRACWSGQNVMEHAGNGNRSVRTAARPGRRGTR